MTKTTKEDRTARTAAGLRMLKYLREARFGKSLEVDRWSKTPVGYRLAASLEYEPRDGGGRSS